LSFHSFENQSSPWLAAVHQAAAVAVQMEGGLDPVCAPDLEALVASERCLGFGVLSDIRSP
jgi:hypothetical protein